VGQGDLPFTGGRWQDETNDDQKRCKKTKTKTKTPNRLANPLPYLPLSLKKNSSQQTGLEFPQQEKKKKTWLRIA
jgi:hypothetical protein